MADTEKEDQGSPMKYPKPLPSLLMPQRPCVLEYVRAQIYVSVIWQSDTLCYLIVCEGTIHLSINFHKIKDEKNLIMEC